MQVFLSWFWNWVLNARDARLITGPGELDVQVPRPLEFVRDEGVVAEALARWENEGGRPRTEGA